MNTNPSQPNQGLSTKQAAALHRALPAVVVLALALLNIVSACSETPNAKTTTASHLQKHVAATGGDLVFQMLPSHAVFRNQVPEQMRTALPPDPTPFGDRVAVISGDIHVEATDRTGAMSEAHLHKADTAKVRAKFTTADGSKWRVVLTEVATRKPDGSATLFAGVGVDQVIHGNTGKENPLMPKMKAALTMWGYAKVYKNGALVNSHALLHIMVTSRARSLADGRYTKYDVTEHPVDEIHLFLNPANRLPSPGGFLHVNWERSTVKR